MIAELGNHHAATAVRDFPADPPAWLEVAVPNAPVAGRGIDLGEPEAIAVALEFGADSLIIDDRRGREEAKRRGLAVAGTLSVISDAASAGLLDFDAAITELLESNFRVRWKSSQRSGRGGLGKHFSGRAHRSFVGILLLRSLPKDDAEPGQLSTHYLASRDPG